MTASDSARGRALECLLRPESVAVVGASRNEGSIGFSVIDNLRRLGSEARIYPVNPKYPDIEGLRCFPTLRDIPEPVDCVFIGVRADQGPDVLAEAADCGIRAAVINATGYASGGEEGRKRLARLVDIAAENGMAVSGPNNIGFFNVKERVGLWTLRAAEFQPGAVALITHSGTAAMILGGDPYPLGLAYVITCGDEAVVSAADYLAYVIEDDAVQVVMLFLETIRQPTIFQEAAKRAAQLGKKIIVLKLGKSQLGSKLVTAHTGGVAGQDELYRAFFRKYGIAQVTDMDEMIQTARLVISDSTAPERTGLVPITMSGGIGALVADTATEIGLNLPFLSDKTCDDIRSANPALFVPQNPLDAWGLGWDSERFPGVLAALLAQSDIGCIALCLDVPASGKAETSTARSAVPILANLAAQTSVRFVLINTNGQGTTDPVTAAALDEAGIPCLMGLTESMKALGHWLHWPNPSVVASTDATHVSVREPNPSFSDNVNLLNAAGIPLLGGLVAASEEEAVQQAEAIGFPVVMKGMNPAVLHKTDAGLVHLGISNGDETRTAYRSITSALNRVPVERARNEIIIQPTAKPGLELILGVRNVPYFGTLIVLGLGGIYVEVLRKIACRLAPVDKHGVRDMLRELSLEAIFSGFRGTAPYDVDALAKVVVSLEQLAVANFDAVEFLELNPLIVHRRGEGVTGLDVLIDRPAPVSPSVQTADI